MGFLISLVLLLVFDVFILRYLTMSEFFAPYTETGSIDLWNISVFVFLISLVGGIVVSLLVYVLEKIFYCGRREFPRPMRAIRFGLLTMFCLVAGLFLHVFHFLNLGVIIVLFFLAVVGFILVR